MVRQTRRRATPRGALLAALTAALLMVALVGCGDDGAGGEGGGEGGAATPTRTPSGDRTLDRPTLRPTDLPTLEPSDRPTLKPTDRPTEGPDEETPGKPAPADSERPAVPASPSAEVEEQTASAASDAGTSDQMVPTWLWWLLAALLVGAAIAVPLIVRSRHRAAWRRELADAEGELAWFARELLPQLRHASSREEVAGGWTVGEQRVVEAEDRLTVLASTARDQAGRDRCRELLVASRQARDGMKALSRPGPHDSWALDLDTVMSDLEHVLSGHARTQAN
jgi:hypothetical protein